MKTHNKVKFSEIFKRDYYNKMLIPGHPKNPVRNRADSLLKVFQLLEDRNLDFYRILETGCMRKDHGHLCFGDDGCSSFLFNEFLKYNDGILISVDINQENVNYANSIFNAEKSRAYCCDSVEFINEYYYKKSVADPYKGAQIDLLYLDSFDVEKDNPLPSQQHHLKELNAARHYLGQGSIVVVDDHNAFFTNPPIGKGNLIKELFEKIGMSKKIFEDYQIGWIL